MKDRLLRDLFLGFVKIHILHHADGAPVYGVWLIGELRRHGYQISPGTLYPMLHSLEEDGLLRASKAAVNGKIRKYYRTTARGSTVLRATKRKVQELIEEVLGG